MESLEKFLQSVGWHLPAAARADILAELRANLEAQLEEREEQLGRPMTEAEGEAWVKALGSPVAMAARYGPQRSLIGPGLFPVYWYVLRLVFFWSTVIYLIVSGVLLAVNGPTAEAAGMVALRLPGVWFTSAAWVTLVFAALELAAQRSPKFRTELAEKVGAFNPGPIPGLEEDEQDRRRQKPRSYAQAAAEFVFSVLLLGWLLLIPANPYLLMGPGVAFYQSLPYRVGPVIEWFYWTVVVLNVVQAAWAGVDLMTGAWQGPRRLERLAVKLMGFAPLLVLLAAPQHMLFVLRNPGADEVRLGGTLYTINESVHRGLEVVLVIVALQFVFEVVRAVRDRG